MNIGRLRIREPVAILCVCAWLVPVALGVRYLNNYAAVPEKSERPLSEWPQTSQIKRILGAPSIVMALHAGCPCSRASVAELRGVLERARALSPGPVNVNFLVYYSKNVPVGQQTRGLPGAAVIYDDQGTELKKFRAKVSGEVWMYDASGILRFHGGITGERGHEGRNQGSEILLAILQGTVPQFQETPVFGCSLRVF